jgi:hypothetical protein
MIAAGTAEGATTNHRSVAFVDAPTALAAFQLVLRLPRSDSQDEEEWAGRWVVSVPVAGPVAVQRLLEDVRLWLHGEQIDETRVRVGTEVYRVGPEGAMRSDTRR